METQEKIICRLCLNVCDNFNAIEGDIKCILDIVLRKIDLTLVQTPVMCMNCFNRLVNCLDFKATCIDTHDYMEPFVDGKDSVKLNLVDVYLNKNENVIGVPEDQVICGFCMSSVKNCSAVSIDVDNGDVALENMIEECLPELDFNIIEKPVICTPCHGSLKNCFRFVSNCLIVEAKIKKYCETINVNSKAQIKLNNVLQFTMRDVTTGKVDGNSLDIIEVEKQPSEGRKVDKGGGDIFKLEQKFCEDNENVKEGLEPDVKSFMDMDGLRFNDVDQFTINDVVISNVDDNNTDAITTERTLTRENEFKEQYLDEMEAQKLILHEEIEIKVNEPDLNSLEDTSVLGHPVVTTRLYREEESLMSNLEHESNTYLKHILKIEDISKLKMYQHECEQKKHKDGLKNHPPLHKNPPEMTIYSCTLCSYQAAYRCQLSSHLRVHKNPLEVTMHKCDSCSFQTKYKECLKTHSLVHKNLSEATIFKCDSCPFQTKYNCSLKKHSVVHKNLSEGTMYKCDSCPYQTISKDYFRSHSRVHKDPLKVKMYKCDFCPYTTKWQQACKRHLLAHKNPSEVTMYKCDLCSFQTKYNFYLKKHRWKMHKKLLK